jgi:acyl-coenzyme A thioesterase PaaI-like protein
MAASWPECDVARHIATPQKSAYHRGNIGESRRMPASSPNLPEDAEPISAGGFHLFAGPFYRLPDKGQTRRFAFIALQKHMNAAGAVHGGLLMTFADVAMSRTARLATGAGSCSTVSLNCDFAGAGRLGDLIEIGVRVMRTTRQFVFLSGEAVAGGALVLSANGLWRIAR